MPEPSLEERIEKLEHEIRRLARAGTSRRGYTNQAGAARYLGRSREYLRRLHKLGRGPERAKDKTYSFASLDRFKEEEAE